MTQTDQGALVNKENVRRHNFPICNGPTQGQCCMLRRSRTERKTCFAYCTLDGDFGLVSFSDIRVRGEDPKLQACLDLGE